MTARPHLGVVETPAPAIAAPPSRVLAALDIATMLTTEPPEVPWLAEPMLVAGCVTMLAGREGQGKSWMSLALAVAIGRGSTVAGIECQTGRALIIDGENGQREAHRRIRQLPGLDADRLIYLEADGFRLQEHLADLERQVAHHRPSLVVLDSFRSLWPGGDENDSAAVEPLIRRIQREIARKHHTAVLLLHHAARGTGEYRGSTAIGGAVELGFTLRRHEDDPDNRSRRELVCWKSRPAPEPEPLWISLAHREGIFSLDEADPWAKGAANGSRATVRQALADEILRELALRGPKSRPDLLRAVDRDAKDRTGRRAIDELKSAGHLTETDGLLRVATGGATPGATPRVAGGTPPLRGDTCHLPPLDALARDVHDDAQGTAP